MKPRGLSASEQATLCLCAQGKVAGDPADAENRLMRQYDRLLSSMARRVSALVDFDDALQEARVALLRSIRRYDPGRGVRFSTYCHHAVTNALGRAIQTMQPTIRLSAGAYEELRRIDHAERHLEATLGRVPKEDETAAAAGMSEQRLRERRLIPHRRLSLDDTYTSSSGEALHLGDVLAADGPLIEDATADADERSRILAPALAALTEIERDIVARHYGLPPYLRPQSLTEIATVLGYSKQYVSMLDMRALRAMRSALGLTETGEPSSGERRALARAQG